MMPGGFTWADRIYCDKIRSGDLPDLGPGFSRELRAARAVQGIADRKLYARSRGGHVRASLGLPPHDRLFWRDVLDRANALAVMAGEGTPHACPME